MRRSLIVLLVLIAVSCGPSIEEFSQFKGEQGIEIRLGHSAPPDDIYEGYPIPVKVILHNKGAQAVSYEDMIITFNTDPLYVKNGLLKISPEDMDALNRVLPGRSIGYPTGLDRSYTVPGQYFYAKEVPGMRKEPTTSIQASACYRYTTSFTRSVCIDTAGYEGNERRQSCEQEDIVLQGGQGAPISVTEIEIESVPVVDPLVEGESIKPHFTIHFENTGEGRVIGPDNLDLEDACILRDISRQDIGSINVRAWLLSAELECIPDGKVQMYQGKGKVRCTVGEQNLAAEVFNAKQNFQTVLTVNASYIYKSSVSKEVEIQRTDEVELPRSGEITGYHYEDGVPVTTKCAYYAENPEQAPPFIRERIQPEFSCACTEDQCTLTRERLTCLPALCPGATMCCYRQPEEQEETGQEDGSA